jgi:diguanylate cyclase (GGDEF)-like protein/PAS domain S-box-containing protein
MLDLRCDPDDAEGLRREIARRDKIIRSLVYQVEHSLNSQDSDFGLLQNTAMLEEQVRLRTDELKKSVETLEAFMANAAVGILFLQDHTMVRYNRRFGEMFGFSTNEAIGGSARILFQTDDEYVRIDRLATPLLLAGQPFQTELYLQRRDGSDLWINVIGYVSGAEKAGQTTIWLLEDRTAFKQADEALRRSHDELEARVVERTAELTQQLHFLRQLIEAIPSPLYFKDAEARYIGCNSAFETFTDRPIAEMIGKTVIDVAPVEVADEYLAADRELLAHPGSRIYESTIRFVGGEVREVMVHKATFTRPDGRVGGLVGLIVDITERKRMEDNLRQAATVFESAAEGVSITTPDGAIIAANRAFTEITGYTEDEVIGRNPNLLQSGRHSKSFYREMWGTIARDGRWQGELWNRRKNGDIFPASISITTVRDKEGRVSNYVATFSDISQQKKNEEHIHLLAFSDALTMLPNRRLLLDRLQHAIANSARSKRLGALFFIDLDDFKDLNDTRGHDTGDLLLQQVAQRLIGCVRKGDTVARFGGDEFVVMLEDLSEQSLDAIGETESVGAKILATLNEPYALDGYLHHSTPSIGVTLFGDRQNSMDDLLKQADLAMYQAKGSGRNALRFFDPAMQSVVAARVAMEADLRQGLRADQFILHYQPQVDDTGRMLGAEALLRWQHPQRGMVSPAEFIPVSEETGLILPLGQWVLETACALLCAWAGQLETTHLTLAVNVSAQQFRQPNFVEQVLAALERNMTNPEKLKLELTESLLLDDVEQIIAKMTALKARGVGFSLDDFGTGYSSLSYLKRLPLDQLKIDQSFVRDVLVDPNDASIARTIVALAHSLGLGVIAEGVETAEQLDFLVSNDCLVYQGYLFSRPLPLDKFEQLARQNFLASGAGQEPR